jgi:hypothetical protein
MKVWVQLCSVDSAKLLVVRRPESETDSSHQYSAEVGKSVEILSPLPFKDIRRGDKLITCKTSFLGIYRMVYIYEG